MDHSVYGLEGVPAGDPGFTISVEVDTFIDDLTGEQCTRLVSMLDRDNVRLEQSRMGRALLVFDLPHSGWWAAGKEAGNVIRRLAGEFAVVGSEICRSDVWRSQPYFPHEPDGLGTLPDWCNEIPSAGCCTVAVELRSPTIPFGRRGNNDLMFDFELARGARLTKSPRGARHVVVEHRTTDPASAARRTAKALHAVSNSWSITRVRSVVAEVYRAEVGGPVPRPPTPPVLPTWQYASDGKSRRVVVIADETVDYRRWGVTATRQDGTTELAYFVRDRLWRNTTGIVNLRGIGPRVRVWTASISSGALVDSFIATDRTTLPVDPWENNTAWLIESLVDNPTGLVIDLGPSDYDSERYADREVINAQLHMLDGGVVMLRRSRTVLQQLRLADHSSDGLTLDYWHHDDRFDDCTDGYLFSTDLRLVATACTAWFRDHGGVESLAKLGCSYAGVDTLPRSTSIDAD